MAKRVQRFETILGTETGKELFILIPFDVKEVFGKARAPVHVTIGKYGYRSTVAVYGGKYYIPVRREHRDGAGVAAGDRVDVTLRLDEDSRVVAPPPDLAAALAEAPRARARWDALSPSHQREHASAIEDAKRIDTRAKRVAAAVKLLLAAPATPTKKATKKAAAKKPAAKKAPRRRA